MSDLVSVIIPIYKVEKYLQKCVDSVLAQTYKNLEIFLVDDGSPDKCPQLCDEFAQKDKRIKVIHKQNGGLSSARNAALDICTGEYITFVDSDDWIEPTYVEELYNAIKKYDCDISVCGYSYIDNEVDVYKTKDYKNLNKFYDKDFCELFFCHNSIALSVWAKMYRREIFEEIRFPVGMNYEDAYITTDVCAKIKKGMAIVNSLLYNYLRFRQGSITQKLTPKTFEILVSHRRCVDNIEKGTVARKYACRVLFYRYHNLYRIMENNAEYKKKLLEEFKIDYKKYKHDLPGKTRIRFFTLRYFRKLYDFIWRSRE